jgi:outer membrane protein TolC
MMRNLAPQPHGFTLLLAVVVLCGCASTNGVKKAPTIDPAWISRKATTSVQAPASESIGAAAGIDISSIPAEGSSSPIRPASFDQEPPKPSQIVDAAPVPVEVLAAPDVDQSDVDRPTLPLDLAGALGLIQGRNPRVAFAQAQVSQAYAQYDAARVLWLPSLRAGMNYNKHEGQIQDVAGTNIDVSRGAAFGGMGANAVGAGSPAIPGVYVNFHTTDAIFQRQIAGYALDAREFQAEAVNNDQLLDTALAYINLLDAVQRKAIAADTLKHGEELTKLTTDFVRTGAGNQADADRAAAALAALHNEALRAEEAATIASARLAQQLSWDPTVLIIPQETTVMPIDLVPLDNMNVSDLVATGLSNRPELAANSALVCEAVNRLRREENAPWLPSILLGVSYGAFGAGTGGNITNGGDRFDFDGVAWWELRNLGFGERAARNNARAQIQQARMRELESLDVVAREIVEAHTQVQSRRRQIAFAEQGIKAAEQSYDRNRERIQNVQGLPIEVLQSIQALDAAQREYLRAVVDYNTAQFRLHRALGWPIHGV